MTMTLSDSEVAEVLSLLDQLRTKLGHNGGPLPAPVAPAPAPVSGKPEEAAFTDYGAFYDFLRGNKMLGPKITTSEFEGCANILRACVVAKWPVAWTAYALATAYHETAHTMQPVKEIGGPAYYTRMYDINGSRPKKARELGNLTPGDGARYPGRGYPQLTGKSNYALASKVTGVDLVSFPDRAMEVPIAAKIMVSGMAEGWFSTHKLADYLPAKGPAMPRQFVACRPIINGTDKAEQIAEYAVDFQTGLVKAGYRIGA